MGGSVSAPGIVSEGPPRLRGRRAGAVLLLVLILLALPAGPARGRANARAARQGQPPAAAARVQFERYDLVLAAAWSPTGERLAVAAGENIHLYAADGLEAGPPRELGRLQAGVWSTALAFSPDGARLAAAGRDGAVQVWELPAEGAPPGAPALRFQAHRKGANAVRFSPDGALLASAGNDGMARLWDLEALLQAGGEADPEPRIEMIGGAFAVPAIAFTPDGAGLAIANANVVRLRELESGRFMQTLQRPGQEPQAISFYSLDLSSDGTYLAAGDTENGVFVWDLTTGASLPTPAGHSGETGRYGALVWAVAVSPDGRQVASAGGDGTLRLWDLGSGAELARLEAHALAATCLAFSPDGRWLVSGGLDAALQFWDLGELAR